MKLPKSVIRKIMKDTLKEFRVTEEAVNYMESKMIEFCQRLTKNSIEEMGLDGMRTITKTHLLRTLGKVDLLLKNIPRVENDNDNRATENKIAT